MRNNAPTDCTNNMKPFAYLDMALPSGEAVPPKPSPPERPKRPVTFSENKRYGTLNNNNNNNNSNTISNLKKKSESMRTAPHVRAEDFCFDPPSEPVSDEKERRRMRDVFKDKFASFGINLFTTAAASQPPSPPSSQGITPPLHQVPASSTPIHVPSGGLRKKGLQPSCSFIKVLKV